MSISFIRNTIASHRNEFNLALNMLLCSIYFSVKPAIKQGRVSCQLENKSCVYMMQCPFSNRCARSPALEPRELARLPTSLPAIEILPSFFPSHEPIRQWSCPSFFSELKMMSASSMRLCWFCVFSRLSSRRPIWYALVSIRHTDTNPNMTTKGAAKANSLPSVPLSVSIVALFWVNNFIRLKRVNNVQNKDMNFQCIYIHLSYSL